MEKQKIAILDMSPTHYRVPIYTRFTKEKNINFTVYFSSDHGMHKTFSPAFNKQLKWENDISGFNYKFLKNYYKYQSTIRLTKMWNFGIIKEIIKNKFDAIVIISYTPFSHKLAMVTAKLTKTPIILKEEADLLKQPGGIKGKIKKIILKKIIKNSSAFIYGYSKNKEFYENYGASKKQLFFFPCAVNNEMFQNQRKKLPSKNELKETLGFSSKDFLGIFIGRLIQLKNVMHLIKAVEKLQKKNIPAGLIIVGEGLERENLEKYIKDNNINKIKFIGFKQQSELS